MTPAKKTRPPRKQVKPVEEAPVETTTNTPPTAKGQGNEAAEQPVTAPAPMQQDAAAEQRTTAGEEPETARQNENEDPEQTPVASMETQTTAEQGHGAERTPATSQSAETSQTPARPQPGDDENTLPLLSPTESEPATNEADAKIKRECDLTLYLYRMAEYHALPKAKKINLIRAYYNECATVRDWVEEQLCETESLSGDRRLNYLDQYQAFCRRLVEEATKALDSGHLDEDAVEQLVRDHADLIEQMALMHGMDSAILSKRIEALKAENARLRAERASRPAKAGMLARALGRAPLPPNIEAVGKAVNDELERSNAEVYEEHLKAGVARVNGSPDLQAWITQKSISEEWSTANSTPGVSDDDKRHCFCAILATVRELWQGDSCFKPITSPKGWSASLCGSIHVFGEEIPLERAIQRMWSATKQSIQAEIRLRADNQLSDTKAKQGRQSGPVENPSGAPSEQPNSQAMWTVPEGYTGAKSADVPRSTLETWDGQDNKPGGPLEGKVKRDPRTQEKCYPTSWLNERKKRYTPRKKSS